MTWQALALIFGTLAIAIVVLLCGFFVGDWWGTAMVVAGSVGLMAWVVFMLGIGSAMNSDH